MMYSTDAYSNFTSIEEEREELWMREQSESAFLLRMISKLEKKVDHALQSS